MSNPIVAIVGRPNVGKSTLFNRLVGKRIAIVEDTPGITRDRLYAEAEWIGRSFMLVDTGGMLLNETDPIAVQVRIQAEVAMEEADVIVLIADGTQGVTPTDIDVANLLRRTKKPVLLAVNKIENMKQERDAVEFYSLGLGDINPISSIQGHGVADLLDKIVQALPPSQHEEYPEDAIRIAIVGRPNVGKSSMLNAIVKEERAIVSEVAGTTRDAVDSLFIHEEQNVVLVDTAGIRRAGKVQHSVEYYSVLRAMQAIERADVALLLIDASEGLADGDKRVGGYAHEAGRGVVIVVNKWDKMKGTGITMKKFAQDIRDQMPFMHYAPIVFASAKNVKGVKEILDSAIMAAQSHALRLPTGEINRLIHDAVDLHPLNQKGKQFKVYYATMPTVKPPTVVIFTNDPNMLHFSYQRYLENEIRKQYPYEGTPMRIFARKAESKERRGK
ncbi:MAG TPA: ribosome biogenesis GTPase Der [Armatimonadota bacterium]